MNSAEYNGFTAINPWIGIVGVNVCSPSMTFELDNANSMRYLMS